MGNHNGKDTSGPTGSPLDFFHTPPTTPSEAELTAMALSSSNKAQTPSPEAASGGGGGSSSTPSSTSPEWAQRACAPSEWAVISVEGDTKVGEQSWQERDSGLEAQAGGEPDGEEMSLVLLSLMEHYRPSLGLSPNADPTAGAVELLRHLITERDELAEEVRNLRETLRTERLEWRQFQCDLQVAVSVADRLRMESEQALGTLQESHRSVQAQLAEALGSRREAELRLETLQDDYRDVCARLSQLQQQRAQLDALREACSTKEATPPTKEATPIKEDEEEEPHKAVEEAESAKPDMEVITVDPVEANGSKDAQLTGRGVAEGYLRSLAALEKKKDGQGQRDPRRIVMLSERSWSLSRLPLPTEVSDHNRSSKITSTTLPLCKKEEPTKGRRKDHLLKRQDSWSSFYTGKQEEEQSSESIKPQDGFSALLRRHGGSRRNSLLRWCQGRTQGYKNIEITNFSSSWEDGLAFCAVYHTYLPTHIPYDSLLPVDKKQNLDLAFKTGESVGITATLTAEEMLKAGGPDWQRVLGYVESMFRHFEM